MGIFYLCRWRFLISSGLEQLSLFCLIASLLTWEYRSVTRKQCLSFLLYNLVPCSYYGSRIVVITSRMPPVVFLFLFPEAKLHVTQMPVFNTYPAFSWLLPQGPLSDLQKAASLHLRGPHSDSLQLYFLSIYVLFQKKAWFLQYDIEYSEITAIMPQ